ncbi:restriction endonuclease subunit S [Cloacibacterium sp.]|uniref:restriction endonuclease subunit S n=1 Tax=Cloacibacterium sp. TaxID=1913682 RepID=UPI0039E430B9
MKEENKSVKNFPNSGDLGIPKLRFTEFGIEKWETIRLGEIATFTKGKGISKSDIDENGETECIRYGELYTFYEEVISEIKSKTNTDISSLVLSEANDVIIPASGETQIDIATASCVLKSGVALGGDLNVIKTKNNGVFLSYYLNSKKKLEIAKLSQGISVVHLYSSQLALLNLKLPQLEEQNKLANFLSLLNSRIQTQKKIIEKLETLMIDSRENLFSQKIRFKDDDFSNWEQKKLGDILIESNEKSTKNNQYRVISSTAKGLFYQDEYFTRDIASQDNTGYKVLKKEQLVFSPQNLWLGNINVNTSFEIGLVSPSYKIFDFNTSLTSYSFCNFFLKTSIMLFEYAQSSIQGASVVRRNLDLNMFFNIKILLPSINEQTKIANFLSSIQEKIETEKQILEKLELQKKFLLSNLFI